jgi:hypothetical protein
VRFACGGHPHSLIPIAEVTWYRSTWFNAFVLGMCNLLAPGIWGAMNSLGGGGEQSPWLINSPNGFTFCLMVMTCALSNVFVKYIGIKWTLVSGKVPSLSGRVNAWQILGAASYCPYAAGLYCNNRYASS